MPNPKEQYTKEQQELTQQTVNVDTPPTPPTPPTPAVTPQFTSEQDIINYMSSYAPETPEQKQAREKREKYNGMIAGISDAVSAFANLYFTTQGAQNSFDPNNSLSKQHIARRDKLKAERDKNADRWFNLYQYFDKQKRDDRDYKMRQAQFNEGVRQHNLNIQLQQQQLADREKERQQNENRLQKQFDEGVRQFNVNSERQAKQLELQGKQYAKQLSQGSMTFNLGSGFGNVRLTQDQLNATNVSRIFNSLPDGLKAKVQGAPIKIKDAYNNEKIVYGAPTTEAMLIAIGAHLENSPSSQTEATRNAILQVSGKEKGKPKNSVENTTMPGVGSGTTMPGVK